MTRTLDAITYEIHAALKRETNNIIEIGGLLIEAKARLKHGEWYRWLETNFSLSRQTADNYRKAAEFAAKTPTVSDLNLRPSALYLLADETSPEVIQTVLDEARVKWVGEARALEIIHPDNDLPEPDPEIEADPDPDPEIEPPLPCPPPAPLPREKAEADKFASAVSDLLDLATKPSAKFAGVVLAADLQLVANFLKQIAAATKARLKEAA